MSKRVHQLTEAAVEKAKPGADRREIPDGGGLYLVVHPSGLKSWAVRYRRDGRPRKHTLAGQWPTIGLKAARGLAKAVAESVAHGGDPAAQKAHARRTAADRSTDFPSVVGEFLDRHLTRKKQRPRPRTLAQLAWFLGVRKEGEGWVPRKGGLAERWRSKKVYEITKADVAGILRAEMARGVPIIANRMRAILRWFFSWCLRQDIVTANPVIGTDQPSEEAPRDRVLSDAELALFWRACGEERLYGGLWRLIALTGVRREEARGMRWAELDLDAAIWTIPGGRTKNGREHVVPISPLALHILKAQPRIGGKHDFVFTTTGATALGGLSGAKARLDARMLALAQKANPKAAIARWTTHDLRRTLATGMQKLNVRLEVVESVLGHVSGSRSGIVGIYQRHDWAPEKRAALEAWARHVQSLIDGKHGNVVLLGKVKA